MKPEYIKQAREKFELDLESIEDWEERHNDSPEILKFYNEILKYYFWEIDHPDDHESIGAHMNTSIYSLLKKAVGPRSYEDPADFILGLQSFLSNCVLDDSYYKISYERYYDTSSEEFRMQYRKQWLRMFFFRLFVARKRKRLWRKHGPFIPCKKKDSGAHPILVWSHDMDPDARNDIEGLWEAFNFYIEKEAKGVEIHKTIREEVTKIREAKDENR